MQLSEDFKTLKHLFWQSSKKQEPAEWLSEKRELRLLNNVHVQDLSWPYAPTDATRIDDDDKTFQFQAPLEKKKQLLNERENEFLMSLKKCFFQLQVETVLCAAFFLMSWCVVSEGFGIQK